MPGSRAVIGWIAGLIAATTAALLAPLGPYGAVLLPVAVLLALVAGRLLRPLGPAVITIAAVDLVGFAIMVAIEPDLLLSRGISTQLAVLLAVAVPWWLGRLRQSIVLQARRERELVDQRARSSERSLIAADMHDAVGHDLALIALRAGAWELDASASADQRAAAAAIREQATSATDRLHVIVGLLREGAPGDPSSAADLEALIDRARAAGLSIDAPHLGDRRDGWSVATTQAVHRVLQEALTNAAKHAPGSSITIVVSDAADQVSDADDQLGVEVISRHGSRPAPTTRSGLGLIALDERLRQLGGSFTAEPQRDGFAVRAKIPRRVEQVGDAEVPDRSTPARRQQRRAVRRSALLPAVLALIIAAALSATHVVTFVQTALRPDDFAAITIGSPRRVVADVLPSHRQPGPTPMLTVPAAPADARCEFYLARRSVLDFSPDMFRICFDGPTAEAVVVSKDRLTRQEA